MSFLSIFSKPQIGLDIQPDAIRFVQLIKHRRGYQIQRMESLPLAPSIFSEGRIKQWDELRAQLIELSITFHWRGLPVALAVPMNLVLTQHLQLPAGLSEEQIEIEVYLHIQRELPYITETLCADFHVTHIPHENYVDVHFTAARQEYVSQYTECVAASGLQVKLMDVDDYALQRAENAAFEFAGKQLPDFNQYQLACGLAMREMPLW